MILFELMRKVNRRVKQHKMNQAGKYLSPVRRIERVYPLSNERWCAMTFDDGPSFLPPVPYPSAEELTRIGLDKSRADYGLSEIILATLNTFESKGTFDSIGSTAQNYPDQRGKRHTAKWGGQNHDHYPDMGKDHLGGLFEHPEFGKRLINEGHEIANHGGSHVLFGPIRVIYNSRSSLENMEGVLEDLTMLHNHVFETTDHITKLSRPPHYIDRINGGYSAYDAYAEMGYQYMAASFDGGGWMPSKGNYASDVAAMVEPMRKALELDNNALNGQIIFQKDGCNMSLETPVAHALFDQLSLLKAYGYKVVTVSELIGESPFLDYGAGHEGYYYARVLERAGYIIGYKNNTFQPDRLLTFGELLTMVTPKDLYVALAAKRNVTRRKDFDYNAFDIDKILNVKLSIPRKHPYGINYRYASSKGYLNGLETIHIDSEVDAAVVIKFLNNIKTMNPSEKEVKFDETYEFGTKIKRSSIVQPLCDALRLNLG